MCLVYVTAPVYSGVFHPFDLVLSPDDSNYINIFLFLNKCSSLFFEASYKTSVGHKLCLKSA